MKKFLVVVLLCIPLVVSAKQGCCSKHKGVNGCNSMGRVTCKDGTVSPTCTCAPPKISGCTDPNATNYNPNANSDNKSCKYDILGCTNPKATNYNKNATKDDGSCDYIKGCTDPKALNYNENAFLEDFSCEYQQIDNMENESNEDNITENGIINGSADNQTNNELIIENNEKEKNGGNKNNGQVEETTNDTSTDSINTIVPLAVLGAGGYYAYKKIKNK